MFIILKYKNVFNYILHAENISYVILIKVIGYLTFSQISLKLFIFEWNSIDLYLYRL